jgi:hypothetical protein
VAAHPSIGRSNTVCYNRTAATAPPDKATLHVATPLPGTVVACPITMQLQCLKRKALRVHGESAPASASTVAAARPHQSSSRKSRREHELTVSVQQHQLAKMATGGWHGAAEIRTADPAKAGQGGKVR